MSDPKSPKPINPVPVTPTHPITVPSPPSPVEPAPITPEPITVPFCSYLNYKNERCGAKTGSPCGRHDSDRQMRQEDKLKEMAVESFNKIHEANYSASDLGLPEDASAFDFLCAVFYYLDVNENRMRHSPYIGMSVTIENEHDHRKAECWNQSTYDYSYHCKFCGATSQSPPWM